MLKHTGPAHIPTPRALSPRAALGLSELHSGAVRTAPRPRPGGVIPGPRLMLPPSVLRPRSTVAGGLGSEKRRGGSRCFRCGNESFKLAKNFTEDSAEKKFGPEFSVWTPHFVTKCRWWRFLQGLELEPGVEDTRPPPRPDPGQPRRHPHGPHQSSEPASGPESPGVKWEGPPPWHLPSPHRPEPPGSRWLCVWVPQTCDVHMGTWPGLARAWVPSTSIRDPPRKRVKPWVFISCGAEATTPRLLRQLGVESFRHIPCLLNCDFNRGSTLRCIYFSTLIPRT